MEVGPGRLAARAPVHGGDGERAPRISQSLPVASEAIQPAEAPSLRRDPCPPVHGRSEDVECQGPHSAQISQRNPRAHHESIGAGAEWNRPSSWCVAEVAESTICKEAGDEQLEV